MSLASNQRRAVARAAARRAAERSRLKALRARVAAGGLRQLELVAVCFCCVHCRHTRLNGQLCATTQWRDAKKRTTCSHACPTVMFASNIYGDRAGEGAGGRGGGGGVHVQFM